MGELSEILSHSSTGHIGQEEIIENGQPQAYPKVILIESHIMTTNQPNPWAIFLYSL